MEIRQTFYYPIRAAFPEILKGKGKDVFGGDPSFRLLLDPFPQAGRCVSKDFVAGEFRVSGWNKSASFIHIVGVVDGVSAPLEEKGYDDPCIEILRKALGQGFHLSGEVAPQGGVASTHDHERTA